jgi:hypothetical protein
MGSGRDLRGHGHVAVGDGRRGITRAVLDLDIGHTAGGVLTAPPVLAGIARPIASIAAVWPKGRVYVGSLVRMVEFSQEPVAALSERLLLSRSVSRC